MQLTRREFVTWTAATVAGPALLRLDPPTAANVEVVDLGPGCVLRESLMGYRSAVERLTARRATLIIPAAVRIPAALLERIQTALGADMLVILESGAAFAAREEFTGHRDMLRNELALRLATPVHLWPRCTPYVEFSWPAQTTLRDFSRVVPVAAGQDEIARVDGMAVGLRRQLGRSLLIFLGSPLGPALWAGDADANRWLAAALRS